MKFKLVERRIEKADGISFVFKPKKKIEFQAGQYLFFTLPHPNLDNRGITRYFTISSTPSEENIMITTRIDKDSSTFKKTLDNLKEGDEIEANGPDGNFIVKDLSKNYIFIAGGIGITPFRSILLENDNNNKKLNAQLLYANRNEQAVFKEEFESLKKNNPNLRIKYFISPTYINPEEIKQLDISSIFYISGPTPFVRTIRNILKDQNVPKEDIKLDFFPGYAS